jgi:secreted PhoX family phosphatase
MNRRSFLTTTPFAVAAAMQSLAMLGACGGQRSTNANDKVGYGSLRPAKSRNTGETLLALPEGFEYTVFGKTGSKMSDGHLTPRNHDGMAAFDVGGQLRLIRNHEINNKLGAPGAAIGDPALAYDAMAGGGAVTLVIDPKTRELIRDFVSLNGTLQNCAGGPTPWGSWISCEETTFGPNRITDTDGSTAGGFARNHGYCFEVSAAADRASLSEPLKAMGRFRREAIAVDARSGIVYQTEDANPAGFYRFIPNEKGELARGGELQMLAVAAGPQIDLRKGRKQGESLPAHWVDIAEPDPSDAELGARSLVQQGLARGGAIFARLEGCWDGGDGIFFSSTNGGDKSLGQIWQYFPQGEDSGVLKLIFESASESALDMPDNLCVSPRGALVICEDARNNTEYVRGLTRDGQVFDLALNLVPGYEGAEFAGATFSPDGETLFFNNYTPGMTFAVWGPWDRGAL